MKKRVLSLLLSLSLFCTLFMPGTTSYAEEGGTGSGTGSGMVINKKADKIDDDTYKITLEAYATGSKVINQVKVDVPTDIVLVLDQSGSMDDDIGTVDYKDYTGNEKLNKKLYGLRHNGGSNDLWYKDKDGIYHPVSVTLQSKYTTTKYNNGTRTNSFYHSVRSKLYAKVKGKFQKVTVDIKTNTAGANVYSYKLPNGTEIAISSYTGSSNYPKFDKNIIDEGALYTREIEGKNNVYTYTYTDANGATQTIGTSTGADEKFDTTLDTTLYKRIVTDTGGGSRLDALKKALNSFTDAVIKKTAGVDGIPGNADDINHRIAVVGYAYDGNAKKAEDKWKNTEVFIGNEQYNYSVDAEGHYGSAFQDMSTEAGQKNVADSIAVLDAYGATYTNYGLEMANGILEANPVPEGEKRNRVIILFTDGYPGKNATNFDAVAANTALTQANIAKGAGVSLYSVGIFAGADPTSAGNSAGSITEAANWFMQNVSSNNGTPQTPSYYLSADDETSLTNIFKQISKDIEYGGAATTLSEKTVIKDVISPQFTLPEGADSSSITLKTYSYIDDGQWEENIGDAMGAAATVKDNQVSVTGFDFAANYVGTETGADDNVTYRGDKLVISFDVSLNKDFLGGNNVATNSSAGVYKDSTATDPALPFPQPTVDIPIGNVSVTANDKNVYLLQGLTKNDLFTVKVGAVTLDLTKDNYGLAAWQTEYVNIDVEIKDKAGNMVTDLENLTDDQQYTATVTVSPKYGVVDDQSTKRDEATANVNVFKPEITFQDSSINLGQTPNYATDNYVSVVWKHGDQNAKDADMTGSAPDLSYTYSPAENDAAAFKTDTYVNVTVKIGETTLTPDNVTFKHKNCTPACGFDSSNGQFIVHINTFDLTITKVITNYERKQYGSQDFVFNVKSGDGKTDINVVVNVPDNEKRNSVTIKGLPVGKYTITEDTGWSWRYGLQGVVTGSTTEGTVNFDKNSASATYTPGGTNNEIIFTNNWLNAKWLSFTNHVKNIFGKPNT